jgi:integrase
MSTLFRRGKAYWLQIYNHGKRRRLSLQTDNYGVARAKVRKMDHEAATVGLQLPTTTPVGLILQKYAEHLRSHGTGKGAQSDIYRLAEFFGPVCPALARNSRATRGQAACGRRRSGRPKVYECKMPVNFLEEVTTSAVSEFLIRLKRARGLSKKTLNEYREILQRLFNWAIDVENVRLPGEARRNPVTDVPRYHVDDPTIRFLTLPQIHEQLKALVNHPQLQAMVAVYIYAGVRREEALWLTRDDVDLQRGVLHVRAKTVDGRSWRPKTGRNRVVPISRALKEHLARYTPSIPWYFPAPTGGRWDPDNFSHHLATINAAAGLQWTCLHYRHTFGSHLAQRGESLYKISKMMGNSPEICRRHYAHLTPESLVGSVDFDSPTSPHVGPAMDSTGTGPIQTIKGSRSLPLEPYLKLAS